MSFQEISPNDFSVERRIYGREYNKELCGRRENEVMNIDVEIFAIKSDQKGEVDIRGTGEQGGIAFRGLRFFAAFAMTPCEVDSIRRPDSSLHYVTLRMTARNIE